MERNKDNGLQQSYKSTFSTDLKKYMFIVVLNLFNNIIYKNDFISSF